MKSLMDYPVPGPPQYSGAANPGVLIEANGGPKAKRSLEGRQHARDLGV